MFPIWDARGRVVAFTGRVLDEKDSPKYLNTATTKIFDKGKILYALNLASEKIRSQKQVILCEGQMDVIACFAAGYDWAVCSSGTAVTKQQLVLLKRLTDNILVSFDNDAAGQKAAYRLTQMALETGLVVRIVDLGNFKDPDEMIRSDKAKWQEAVTEAISFVEYFLRVFDDDNKGVKDKSRLADQIMPLLYYVGDEVEKGHYLSTLADVLDVDKKFVLEKYNKYKPEKQVSQDVIDKNEDKISIEERLVGLVVVFYDILRDKIIDLQENTFSDKLEKIVEFLRKYDREKLSIDDLNAILDKDELDWWRKIVVKIETDYAMLDEDLIEQEFKMLVRRWQEVSQVNLKVELEKKILLAEKTNDKEKIKQYIRSLQDLIIKGK
jgi:DNA primase